MEMDERLRWIEVRVGSSLKPRAEELKHLLHNEENRYCLLNFLSNQNNKQVFVYYAVQPKQTLCASLDAPAQICRKFIVFIKKPTAGKVTRENINDELFYMDWNVNILEHFEVLTRMLFIPMLSMEQGNAAQSDKMLELLHRLLSITQIIDGKNKGTVILPLPTMKVLSEVASYSHRRPVVIHILETTLIGWIKQIKVALKFDIEADIRKIHGAFPMPDAELKFWRDRQSLVHVINEQICSPQIINILMLLEEAGSSYAQSFHLIKRDIASAENEIVNNFVYLRTLETYFDAMLTTHSSEELICSFRPMMHTLLLVWTYSRYYHYRTNLHRLLKMISNQIITKAKLIVGTDIFDNEESNILLKECLQICAAFRGTYLDTKEQADAINKVKIEEQSGMCEEQTGVTWHSSIYRNARTKRGLGLFTKVKDTDDGETANLDSYWEDSPWPARSSPVFSRLNSFMERCNDALELVEVTQQFSKLKIVTENNGAGSTAANAQVVEIQELFREAWTLFNENVKDLLDMRNDQKFESSFFQFRSSVRDLEIRLGGILVENLKFCWDTKSKLCLLEVFHGVLRRELVQTALKKILEKIVEDMQHQISNTTQLFAGNVTRTCSHRHLPPIADQLLWLRSLLGRLEDTMTQMNGVVPICFKGETGWKLKDSFLDLRKNIKKKEKDIIEGWLKNFDVEILNRLKEPLLEYNQKSITVNLDVDLLTCLHEINYLISYPVNLQLPSNIMQKVQQVDAGVIQSVALRLKTAISQYQLIIENIQEIEKPLVHEKLMRAEKMLEEGKKRLIWNDVKVHDYVEDVVHLICNDLFRCLQCFKQNYNHINNIINSWSSRILELCYEEPMLALHKVEEWHDKQKSINNEINTKVLLGYNKIKHLLEQSFQVIQLSRTSPQWLTYLDHINQLIKEGIQQSIITSLQYLYNNMVAKSLQVDSTTLQPILQIDIQLIGWVVFFSPPIEPNFSETSLQEFIQQWLQDVTTRDTLLKPLASTQGDVTLQSKIQLMVDNIKELVDDCSVQCKNLCEIFKDYAFLWTQDVNSTFKEFLCGNINVHHCEPTKVEGLGQQKSRMGTKSRNDLKDNSSVCSSVVKSVSTGYTSHIMGLGDKQILKRKESDGNPEPDLDDFDAEIAVFQNALKELQTADKISDLTWLRVNMQPILETIETYASKWLYTYTKYLSDQVQETLNSLDTFLNRVEPSIEGITGDEQDITSLMKLMNIFNEVSCQQTELDGKFVTMKKTIQILEKYGQNLPETTQRLYAVAPLRWNNLKMKVNQAKQLIGPKIQAEEKHIVKVLQNFNEHCENLRNEMEDSHVYTRNVEVSFAYTMMDQFEKELDDINREAQDLVQLQELLDQEIVDFTLINRIKDELVLLHQVWETYKFIKDQHTEWKRHRWNKIKTRLLKKGLQAQHELVKRLSDKAHSWDITMYCIEIINEIQVCIPIMEDLGKASLRPRHWKQLLRLTGSTTNVNDDTLSKMTLKQLIELGLQHNLEEVCSIVKKSMKDVTIENMLKLYEEIWLSKTFEMKKHTKFILGKSTNDNNSCSGSEFGGTESEIGFGSTPYMTTIRHRSRLLSVASITNTFTNFDEDPERFLVDNVQPILEELHSHQISLQSVSNSTAATSFFDDIVKWQKALQQIELFIQTLTVTQDNWKKLDEIYSYPDMKSAYPHESIIFAATSREFISITKAIQKKPNMMQVVSDANIQLRLEKISMNMNRCEKAMLQQLDRRRQKNPLLLLLSTEEAHFLLSHGYDPRLLVSHLYKIFNNIHSLEVNISEDGLLYQIIGFYSLVNEYVLLPKAVICEHGIEAWLGNLQNSIKSCNQLHLSSLHVGDTIENLQLPQNQQSKSTVASCNSNDRFPVFIFLLKSLLPSLPECWPCGGSTDAIILSIKITVTTLVNQHLQAFMAGNSVALKTLLERINALITSLSEFLLAQTKVIIQSQSLQKFGDKNVTPFDLDNLNIAPQHESVTSVKVKLDTSGENMTEFHIKLIENLIEYFIHERHFVKMLTGKYLDSFNSKHLYPFEVQIHPSYVFDDETSKLDICLGNVTWQYGYEFQGVGSSLLFLSGNERTLYWLSSSIKANEIPYIRGKEGENNNYLVELLASLTGRPIYNYTCSKHMDVNVLTNIFKGAALSGSWISFKNIETLQPTLLSILSSYIQVIYDALGSQQNTITINQEELSLHNNMAIFTVSTNKLFSSIPKTIKNYFRIVSYNPPDVKKLLQIGLIKSGMLLATHVIDQIFEFLSIISNTFHCYSYGFNGTNLKVLLNSFYNNFIENLSDKEVHRIAKELSSVVDLTEEEIADAEVEAITNPGTLTVKEPKNEITEENMAEIEQNIQFKAIVLALHNTLSPALSLSDLPLFERILQENFPQVNVSEYMEEVISSSHSQVTLVQLNCDEDDDDDDDDNYAQGKVETVRHAVARVSVKKGWISCMRNKVAEISLMLECHRPIILKSCNVRFSWNCIQAYLDVYKSIHENTRLDVISPLILSSGELFGHFDPGKGNWKTGVLSKSLSMCSPDIHHFVVVEGNVSSQEEVMFQDLLAQTGPVPVLNGLLKIPSNVCIIWLITEDEYNVSEPTSHLPLLKIENPKWQQQIQASLQTKTPETCEHLTELFTQYINDSLSYFDNNDNLIPRLKDEVSYINQLIHFMVTVFNGVASHVQITSDYDNYVNYAAFWTFNAVLNSNDRPGFSVWWKKHWSSEVVYPDNTDAISVVVNPDTHLFMNVNDCHFLMPSSNQYSHTDTTLGTAYLLHILIKSSTSFILSGPCGCGKSSLLQTLLLNQKADESDFFLLFIIANKFLTTSSLWERLNEVFEWKHSTLYQPVGNKKLVCWIENIHQGWIQSSKTSSTAELIYQLVHHGGAYNPMKDEWQQFNDTTFVITYNPTFTPTSHKSFTKLMAVVPVISLPYPTSDDQTYILHSLLSMHFLTLEDEHLLRHDILSLTGERIKHQKYALEMKELISVLVNTMVDLQENTRAMFQNTSKRFHYVSNMRTLKRITKSLCETVPYGCSGQTLLEHWYYAVYWAYTSMLIDDVDKDRWYKTFHNLTKKRMNRHQLDILNENVPIISNVQQQTDRSASTIQTPCSTWNCINTFDLLQKFIGNKIVEYNKEHPRIKISCTEDVVRLIYHLLHVVQSSFLIGHCLIIAEGYPASVPAWMNLLSFISGFQLMTLNKSEIVQNGKYTLKHLKKDLIQCFKRTGLKNEKILLVVNELDLFDDSVITNLEEFLQFGLLMHLFNDEEKNGVINSIRTSGDQEMAGLTKIEAWNVFISCVRENMRVVVTFSSLSKEFEEVAYKHPSLMSSLSVIYLPHWSKRELVDFAQRKLKELDCVHKSEIEKTSHILSSLHLEIQQKDSSDRLSGLHGIITNNNFELFIERFGYMHSTGKTQLDLRREQITTTLKTAEASLNSIAQMKKKLEHERNVLFQKEQGCTSLLTQIGQDRAITEEQIRLVEKTKKQIEKLECVLPQYEEAHKRAVFKAAAIVKDTKHILSHLDDKGLSDLRSLQKPDAEIEDLLAAVIIIVKSPTSDLTWNRGAKRIMANLERFKEEISAFDETELPESTLTILRPYINRPHFVPDYLKNRTNNPAIGSLVLYVRGVVRYNFMLQSRVKPLLQKINNTRNRLDDIKERLTAMESKLKDLNKRMKTLSSKYEEASVEKSKQREIVGQLVDMLDKAREFESLLATLMRTWMNTLSHLGNEIRFAYIQSIIAAGFSVYMGPYPYMFRKDILATYWMECLNEQGIELNKNSMNPILSFGGLDISHNTMDSNESTANHHVQFSNMDLYDTMILGIVNTLAGESILKHLLTTNVNKHDIENMAIMTSPVSKTLFLIDPMNRFKNLLHLIKLPLQQVVELDYQQRSNDVLGLIEKAASNGSILVVYNIDETIDNVFHPFIHSSLYQSCITPLKDGFVKVNGRRLHFHKDFKLILVSRLNSPRLATQYSSICEVINFAPNCDVVATDIKQTAFHSLHPELWRYRQEVYYKFFTSIKHLMEVDSCIMMEIRDKSAEKKLWLDTTVITALADKRSQVCSFLGTLLTQLEKVLNLFKNNDHCIKPFTILFEIMNSVKHMNSAYECFHGDFVDMTETSFRKHCKESETKQFIEDLVYPFNEIPHQSEHLFTWTVETDEDSELLSIDNSLFDMVFKDFQILYLTYMKRMLSRTDYEVFGLVHMLLMKTFKESMASKQCIDALIFHEADVEHIKKQIDETNKPSWLPNDQYAHMMNLIDICPSLKQIFNTMLCQPELLKSWFEKPCPERTLLPYRGRSVPDELKYLSLLMTKSVRPDRLYHAIKDWTLENNEEILKYQSENPIDVIASLDRRRPVLIINDTSRYEAIDIVKKLSQQNSIRYEYQRITSEFDETFNDVLTSIVQNDVYLVIEDLHLVHRDIVERLYNRLERLQHQKQASNWRVFFITNNCDNLREPMVQLCHLLSLSSILENDMQEDLSWSETVGDNMVKSLQNISDDIWKQMEAQSLQVRTLIYSSCILHAYLLSSETFQSEHLLPVTDKDLHNGLRWMVSNLVEEERCFDDVFLQELQDIFCENIYGNKFTDFAKTNFEAVLMEIVFKTTIQQSSTISIGDMVVPVPPANIKPCNYALWLQEKFSGCKKDNLTMDSAGMKFSLIRKRNIERSTRFLAKIKTVLLNTSNRCQPVVNPDINMKELHQSVLTCNEHLPEPIEISEPEDVQDKRIQLIRNLIFSNCHQLNGILLKAKKTLQMIDCNICGGDIAIPADYQEEAKTLSTGVAPSCWLRKKTRGSLVPIQSWLQDMNKCCMLFTQLLHQTRTYFYPVALGDLKHVDLGIFSNVSSLIHTLKQITAVGNNVSLDQICLKCCLADPSNMWEGNVEKVGELKPILVTSSLHLCGGSIVFDGEFYIDKYRNTIEDTSEIPLVYIWADTAQEDNELKYRCPVYWNKQEEEVLFRLPFLTKLTANELLFDNPYLVLHCE